MVIKNKGVAGGAFCKHMKIKRMDGRNLGLAGADLFGVQKRRIGEDELRYTRERIACQYG
jgi:hypothetical protein